ncbi:MAG: DUF2334 domain-containing protein [Vulcanimicrobiota bacterium]
MKKTSLVSALLLLLIPLAMMVLLSTTQSACAAPLKKVLILFDDKKGDDASRAGALQISNLLGHFGAPAYMVPVSLYEKGEIKKYSFITFAGCQAEYNIPGDLIEDLLESKDRIFWIGNHIEQLLSKDTEKKLGIEFVGKIEGVSAVTYKGTLLSKGNPRLNEVKTDKRVKIHAWAEKDSRKLPYIMQTGNFWYVADVPFSYVEGADRYLAFCDILHEFIGEAHNVKPMAAVRIEDINPSTKPECIKEIADILSSMSVPFQISLVPLYVDPATDQEIPLSSRPRLVGALRYAVSKGGTIVLHGYSHQLTGTTTIDSEFWDTESGKPVKDDSPKYVEKKLKGALEECFKCTLFPLMWETPQYLASSLDYRIIARYFSTASERRIFLNQYYITQSFPFIIEKDTYGQRIIPEYLGYIPFSVKEGKEDVDAEMEAGKNIVGTAEKMKCLRDCVAGFVFHPFLDSSVLKETVQSMKNRGFKFIDVRDFNNVVFFEDKGVVSGKGTLRLYLKGKFLREYLFDEQGRERKEKISRTKLTTTVKKAVTCKPGWLYVAEGIDSKPTGSLTRFFSNIAERVSNPHRDEKKSISAAILWKSDATGEDARNQEAYRATLQSLGIPAVTIDSPAALKQENVLIIPHGNVPLLGAVKEGIFDSFFLKGGILILDGFSELSRSLGISRGGKVEVKGVKDVYNTLEFFTSGIMEIVTPAENDKVVYQSNDGFPIGIVRREKEGGIFFLSTMYDSESGRGYSRFPTMITIVLDFFKLHPPTAVPRLEAYFDPGLRQNESVEVLAKRWRKEGIRAIHLATWHFYPTYTFDYKRLISVCHKQGIAVYAWLELPYLNKAFWDNNPKFREKNFQGKDLHVSWRYPLALEDRECREAVLAEVRKLLTSYDFDGVNLAEIYFEGEGLTRPETYAPFHPGALKEFRKLNRFDAREIFSPASKRYHRKNPAALKAFLNWREDMVTSLHRDCLTLFTEIREEKKDFDIVVTVVDSIKSPEVKDNWGVNSQKLAELLKDYSFTFVVEDPMRMWDLTPDRYEALIEAYTSLGIPMDRLGMDLNVVDCHREKSSFAYTKQAGAELFQLLRSASKGGCRVIVYGEATILEGDLPYCASAIESPPDLVYPSPQKELLDPIHLLWMSGDIVKFSEKGGEEVIDYTSSAACYTAVNRDPLAVWVDGEKYEVNPLMGEGEWILRLPSGKHTVRILGESRLSFEVELFSYFEAQLLFFFGLFSCGLLLTLLLFNRVRRKRNG